MKRKVINAASEFLMGELEEAVESASVLLHEDLPLHYKGLEITVRRQVRSRQRFSNIASGIACDRETLQCVWVDYDVLNRVPHIPYAGIGRWDFVGVLCMYYLWEVEEVISKPKLLRKHLIR